MPISLPYRQSNGRSEDARPEHHRRYGENAIGHDREVPLVCSKRPVRQQVPGSGSTASGLRLVFDRDRGADLLTIDSLGFLGDSPALGGRTPPERERGLVPHPSVGGTSPTASRPRNLSGSCALSMGWRAPPREARRCSRRGGESWAQWARKCLTRKRPEVTVRSTSPLWRLVLGFLETETDRGGAVYVEPRSRWSTRPVDGSHRQDEILGDARRSDQSRADVNRKVRTER